MKRGTARRGTPARGPLLFLWPAQKFFLYSVTINMLAKNVAYEYVIEEGPAPGKGAPVTGERDPRLAAPLPCA